MANGSIRYKKKVEKVEIPDIGKARETFTQTNYGKTISELDNLIRNNEVKEKALQQIRELRSSEDLSDVQKGLITVYANNLGHIAGAKGKYELAREFYKEAMENGISVSGRINIDVLKKAYLVTYYEQAKSMKKDKDKVELYKEMRKEAERLDISSHKELAMRSLVETYLNISKSEDKTISETHYETVAMKEAVDLCIELGDTRTLKMILNPENKYPVAYINNEQYEKISILIVEDLMDSIEKDEFYVRYTTAIDYIARAEGLAKHTLFMKDGNATELTNKLKELWDKLDNKYQEAFKEYVSENAEKEKERRRSGYDFSTIHGYLFSGEPYSFSFFKTKKEMKEARIAEEKRKKEEMMRRLGKMLFEGWGTKYTSDFYLGKLHLYGESRGIGKCRVDINKSNLDNKTKEQLHEILDVATKYADCIFWYNVDYAKAKNKGNEENMKEIEKKLRDTMKILDDLMIDFYTSGSVSEFVESKLEKYKRIAQSIRG